MELQVRRGGDTGELLEWNGMRAVRVPERGEREVVEERPLRRRRPAVVAAAPDLKQQLERAQQDLPDSQRELASARDHFATARSDLADTQRELAGTLLCGPLGSSNIFPYWFYRDPSILIFFNNTLLNTFLILPHKWVSKGQPRL